MDTVRFSSVARTHVGCRRKLNEDCVLADAGKRMWAVADGMGGHDAGEVASAMVVAALEACQLTGAITADRARVSAALEGANSRIHALAAAGEERLTMGSTVACLIADADAGTFACLWAGDSRIYLVRNGEARQLTQDHSLVQTLVSSGMLSADEADSHPNANVITRAIGVAAAVDVDGIVGPVLAGDVFVVASDGLTRLVGAAELAGVVSGHGLAEAADRLIALTLERNAPDNVSLVLVQVS